MDHDRMPHATLLKFGYPHSLLLEGSHWCVLLRPQQVTLGALVLVSRSDSHSLASLEPAAFAEMGDMTRDIEAALMRFRPFDKLNYLALMMVDPHVHFHVLPRYATLQRHGGVDFTDPGWPAAPELKFATPLDTTQKDALREDLLLAFKQGAVH